MDADSKPCTACRWHTRRTLGNWDGAALHDLCTHNSAHRLNGGDWAVSIAREFCAGRRWEKKGARRADR